MSQLSSEKQLFTRPRQIIGVNFTRDVSREKYFVALITQFCALQGLLFPDFWHGFQARILYKKIFDLKLSGNEVYNTILNITSKGHAA